MNQLLKIVDLCSRVEDKEILKGVNLEINEGEIHVIMGPNGAGKSTLANTLMGNPKYEVTSGNILFYGEDLIDTKVEYRAKKGMFLSFQHPEEIPGITIENFLRVSRAAITGENQKVKKFKKLLNEKMDELGINHEYASRYINVGFSGGEKKKNEILQMSILEPYLAILDETDSGLDMDALKIVAEGVRKFANKENGILVITHYERLLEYLKPDFVHVLVDGKIIKTGNMDIVKEIEEFGYDGIRAKQEQEVR